MPEQVYPTLLYSPKGGLMTTDQLKLIFQRYNVLKEDCGKYPRFELKRLNKALGLAQKNIKDDKYHTTLTGCTCPDAMQRGYYVCKHRLALMLTEGGWAIDKFEETGAWSK